MLANTRKPSKVAPSQRYKEEAHGFTLGVKPRGSRLDSLYINESKRILTIRRKNVALRHLQDLGTTAVERKHGVCIHLSEYELDMYPSEAKTRYAEKHEELWIEFVREAVDRSGHSELKDEPGITKKEFAAKIRNLD